MINKFEPGSKVWIRYAWSADCWVAGTVIRETAKRYLVQCDRGAVFFSKHNVKARD